MGLDHPSDLFCALLYLVVASLRSQLPGSDGFFHPELTSENFVLAKVTETQKGSEGNESTESEEFNVWLMR